MLPFVQWITVLPGKWKIGKKMTGIGIWKKNVKI